MDTTLVMAMLFFIASAMTLPVSRHVQVLWFGLWDLLALAFGWLSQEFMHDL